MCSLRGKQRRESQWRSHPWKMLRRSHLWPGLEDSAKGFHPPDYLCLIFQDLEAMTTILYLPAKYMVMHVCIPTFERLR